MHPFVELTMTFREGGAYDYDATFRMIKERLQQAYDVARENGQLRGGMADANMANVDLEQLPAYAPNDGPSVPPNGISEGAPAAAHSPVSNGVGSDVGSQEPEALSTPDEPPPDYIQSQVQTVGARFEDMDREEALSH